MKITVEFDLSKEEDAQDLKAFQNMRRNARFWDELYYEVFRKDIKHGDEQQATIHKGVWDKVNAFMESISDEDGN